MLFFEKIYNCLLQNVVDVECLVGVAGLISALEWPISGAVEWPLTLLCG